MQVSRRVSDHAEDLVATCRSSASATSCLYDSSCSVTRFSSFLSWLSSVARGLFFFFEAPSRAIRVLLAPNLEDFQRLTIREADQKTPWPESLLDNEVEFNRRRKPSPQAHAGRGGR